MKLRAFSASLPLLALALARCGDPSVQSGGEGLATVSDDNLNGLWVTTEDGQKLSGDAVLESWPAVGVRLHLGGDLLSLTRSGDTLTAPDGTLAIAAHGYYPNDDTLDGTLDGKTVHFARDTKAKPVITLDFPGDRPFRSLLTDVILPLAQQDRESYVVMHASKVGAFLHGCELYKHGSWQYKFMAGDTWAARNASFANVVGAVENVKTTPRQLTHEKKFVNALKANLKDPSLAALAISTFSMYFSTAAGRSIHIPMAPDATAYFITDRPSRAERIGLVAMDTPLHGTLASTFGRQLLDMGSMPSSDDPIYARAMMELLAKSDNRRVASLSPAGRSAITDWFAVMAIEDYRGVAFGWPDLDWGWDMTNAQFYGLVVRALARPSDTDSAGNPVLGQVLVGGELRPGDPSYADVLNGGGDMQEYPDMSALKVVATAFLRERHPDLVAAVESAFAGVVPKSELDWSAQQDVFRYVTAELYDSQGRTANLKGASADAAVDAVTALLGALVTDSAAFEAYVLSQGYTKSNVPAPKSTGF
jgi:hypothetical protein